jgi:hypothetical protein
MIEYKPHQLRREVVIDAQANRASSTASARPPFELGFAPGDVAGGERVAGGAFPDWRSAREGRLLSSPRPRIFPANLPPARASIW